MFGIADEKSVFAFGKDAYCQELGILSINEET